MIDTIFDIFERLVNVLFDFVMILFKLPHFFRRLLVAKSSCHSWCLWAFLSRTSGCLLELLKREWVILGLVNVFASAVHPRQWHLFEAVLGSWAKSSSPSSAWTRWRKHWVAFASACAKLWAVQVDASLSQVSRGANWDYIWIIDVVLSVVMLERRLDYSSTAIRTSAALRVERSFEL